jgi:3',5'-cyclic AMP phosphodiesterase CpdA
MPFRIAQISDTHLSRGKPFFVENFERAARHVAQGNYDLVINSGDVSLDGSGDDDDLQVSRRFHDATGLPLRYIPGNHDVGESHDTPLIQNVPVISDGVRDRYISHFGPDFWRLDVPGWRLLALDAQLIGSELRAAEEQYAFIRSSISGLASARLAVFIHKPLCHLALDETEVGGRFINPVGRRRLLEALGGVKPALIASGHVHQYVSHIVDGSHHFWAPSTGFFLSDDIQPVYGLKQVGYASHSLHADGTHHSEMVVVPGLDPNCSSSFPTAYDQYQVL